MDAGLLQRLQPANRTGQVVDQLTEAILSGTFRDTSLLPPERVLAETLGVSRPVMREAMQVLQSRGLLAIKHGVGTRITRHSSEPVQHAFTNALYGKDEREALVNLTEVRLFLEVEIAGVAARRATDADLALIAGLLQDMESSLGDPDRYVELDMAFHLAIARATGNELFALMLDASSALSRKSRLESLAAGTTTRESQAKHRAIFEAISAHDPDAAAREMREHLQTVLSDLL